MNSALQLIVFGLGGLYHLAAFNTLHKIVVHIMKDTFNPIHVMTELIPPIIKIFYRQSCLLPRIQLYKFFGNAFFIFSVFSYRETSILSSLCCPIEEDEDADADTYQAAKNGDNLPMFQFLLAPVAFQLNHHGILSATSILGSLINWLEHRAVNDNQLWLRLSGNEIERDLQFMN